MDENMRLLLEKTWRAPEWEDEEKANWDYETLRMEFRKRLYAQPPEENGQKVPDESQNKT